MVDYVQTDARKMIVTTQLTKSNKADLADFAREFSASVKNMRKQMSAATRMYGDTVGKAFTYELARYTVPNVFDPKSRAVIRQANSPGVVKLRSRIAEDITGRRDGTVIRYAVPIRRKDGTIVPRYVNKDGSRASYPQGGLPIVVPVLSKSGIKVPMTASVGEALNRVSRMRKTRGPVRRVAVKSAPVIWATEKNIQRAVRQKQAWAGYTLSGWARADAALRGKASSGLHPGLGAPGDISMQASFGRVDYTISNDAPPRFARGGGMGGGYFVSDYDVESAVETNVRLQQAAIAKKLTKMLRESFNR